jgi:hypothetical protein
MSKILKVSTTDKWGNDHAHDFAVSEGLPEDMYIVAVLKGILQADSVIRHFETVEA